MKKRIDQRREKEEEVDPRIERAAENVADHEIVNADVAAVGTENEGTKGPRRGNSQPGKGERMGRWESFRLRQSLRWRGTTGGSIRLRRMGRLKRGSKGKKRENMGITEHHSVDWLFFVDQNKRGIW